MKNRYKSYLNLAKISSYLAVIVASFSSVTSNTNVAIDGLFLSSGLLGFLYTLQLLILVYVELLILISIISDLNFKIKVSIYISFILKEVKKIENEYVFNRQFNYFSVMLC